MRLLFLIGIITFIMGFGLAQAQEADPAPFLLTGQLRQGTADGPPIPPNLPLTLRVLNQDGQEVANYSGLSQADSSFGFPDVLQNPDFYYVVSTEWAGLTQSSLPTRLADMEGPLDFPLYELTESLSQVIASMGNLRVDFEEINELGVSMLLEISYGNLGDRIVWASPNTDQAQSFRMELPVGALGVAPEEAPNSTTQRYRILNETNGLPIPTLIDTQPLIPNWPNLLRVSFFLPYDEGAVVDIRLPVALSDLTIFLRQDVVSLESELFTLSDQTQTTSGRSYQVYTQNQPFDPNQAIKFTLLGRPESSLAAPVTVSGSSGSSSTPILILGGLGGLILVLLLVWLFLARQNQARAA
jgi:hypothetical protein